MILEHGGAPAAGPSAARDRLLSARWMRRSTSLTHRRTAPLDAILRPELGAEARELFVHRVEQALVLAQPRFARGARSVLPCRRTVSNTVRGFHPSAAAASGAPRQRVRVEQLRLPVHAPALAAGPSPSRVTRSASRRRGAGQATGPSTCRRRFRSRSCRRAACREKRAGGPA